MAFFWVLHDDTGAPLRQTETFDSKDEAEVWLSRSWSALRDEGAASVELFDDDQAVYEMGLDDK
jgi:hypothetical protein